MRLQYSLFVFLAGLLQATGAQAADDVLSFHSDGSIYAGPLEGNGPREISTLSRLQRIDSADEFRFAMDRGGDVIGTCRTMHYQSGTPFRELVPGDMDLSLYDLSGSRRAVETMDTLLRKVDGRMGTKLRVSMANDRSRYLYCYQMGSANRSSRLVFYLQPVGFEGTNNHFAIELQVRGKTTSITDIEIFPPDGAPTRVVARDNRLDGNTVAVVDGEIHINGEAVLRHGKPIAADSVKYHFK
jgi:hypothetical protein